MIMTNFLLQICTVVLFITAGMAAVTFGINHYYKLPSRAVRFQPQFENFVLLSVGTGERVRDSRYKALKHAGKLTWASAAIDISMEGTTQAAHFNLQDIYALKNPDDEVHHYVRVQTTLPDSLGEMDNPNTIERLIRIARDDKGLEEFVDKHVRSQNKTAQNFPPSLHPSFLSSV